ncbi:MAG: low molecular weight phosphotyrosine protein phosphatase [Clostridia bacterium]|nr:low molecular weight phosphotyrosine protein phosphatase [Clostridia bacterium]
MIKVMFVCLGNICRSPMAEFILKDLVKKKGIENEFLIKSSATSYEEIGNDVHYGTVRKLNSVGVPIEHREAVRLTQNDYRTYDYILGMEEANIRNILRIVGDDSENKVYRLLDFSKNSRDIADPWYTGNFDKTYEDILEGCNAFLETVLSKK